MARYLASLEPANADKLRAAAQPIVEGGCERPDDLTAATRDELERFFKLVLDQKAISIVQRIVLLRLLKPVQRT